VIDAQLEATRGEVERLRAAITHHERQIRAWRCGRSEGGERLRRIRRKQQRIESYVHRQGMSRGSPRAHGLKRISGHLRARLREKKRTANEKRGVLGAGDSCARQCRAASIRLHPSLPSDQGTQILTQHAGCGCSSKPSSACGGTSGVSTPFSIISRNGESGSCRSPACICQSGCNAQSVSIGRTTSGQRARSRARCFHRGLGLCGPRRDSRRQPGQTPRSSRLS